MDFFDKYTYVVIFVSICGFIISVNTKYVKLLKDYVLFNKMVLFCWKLKSKKFNRIQQSASVWIL